MPRPSDSPRLSVLAHLPTAHLDAVVQRLARSEHGGGRPWARSRELAAVFAMSTSQAHRILVDLLPRLAALLPETIDRDRRWSWIVDGTLVPTRDHACAAKSKNYRWSCNLQVPGARTYASSRSTAAAPATATIRSTTGLRASASCAETITACSLMVAIAASPS